MRKLNGIICIVCFDRLPELILSVDAVQSANVLNQQVIVVCQRGNLSVERYVESLDSAKFIKIYTTERTTESIKSLINRNVYRALDEAFLRKADYAVLIEDDIEIHRTFLKYVDEIHHLYFADSKFRAVNGFSASQVIPQISNGYGKFRFGVGWGWSINFDTWKQLRSIWNGREDVHWDGLIEPYIRTGFVIMPNTSLIQNHGLNGKGSNSGDDLALTHAIQSSFMLDNKLIEKNWTLNQSGIAWREDCVAYMSLNTAKGKLIDLLFRITFLIREKNENTTNINRIKSAIKALIFSYIKKMV